MDSGKMLRAVDFNELLILELPARELILGPWLPTQGLTMIHAKRGVGKTHMSVGIAYAVASGTTFLNWQTPKPRGVLFVDGEMPANLLRERFAAAGNTAGQPTAAPLRILTPDLQERGIPNLASSSGQSAINEHITDDIGLIIIDNLSTLVRTGIENDAESWEPIQTWALQQRAIGHSVLFIHHSSKTGGQRGTSRREDVLDSVLSLRLPEGHTADQGATFEVRFEKARFFHGQDATPFQARLTTSQNGKMEWQITSNINEASNKMVELAQEGMSQTEIARELGVNKSTVSRRLHRVQEDMRLNGAQHQIPV